MTTAASPASTSALIVDVAAAYLDPPLEKTLAERVDDALSGVVGLAGLDPDHQATLRAAFTLAVITAAALERARREVISRPRVFWQGNADVTREDVQIQKLIGELAAAELSARSALTTALDDVANPDTARAAYLVARSAADHLTSRFFDALGSSASKISAQLNFYWLAARNVTLGRPAPEVAADLGARLLGVAR